MKNRIRFFEQENSIKSDLGRCACIALALLLLDIFQCAPHGFPAIAGARAILLIPAVVCVAMNEGELRGMFFGVFAGALWDVSTGGGDFHALILATTGFVCGLLLNNVMRSNIFTAFILTSVFLAVNNMGHWISKYVVPGLDSKFSVLLRNLLPSYLYSLLLTPLIFALFYAIESAFSKNRSIHKDLDEI